MVRMKRILIMILLCFNIIFLLVGCGNSKYAQKEEEQVAGIANPWTEWASIEETEKATGISFGLPKGNTEEFAMSDLITLCDAGSATIKAAMTNFSEDCELPYTNFEKEISEYSLTWDYFCVLPYEGKEYRLQVSYWKPEKAEEYGYTANELTYVGIFYPLTGDGQLLYETDTRFTPNLDIRSFIDREYKLESYVELKLPEGLEYGNYQMDLTMGQGCLFVGDYEEPIHGDGAPKDWYAPGGIAFAKKEDFPGEIQFENSELKEITVLMNHSGIDSEFEYVEDCDMQAILCEYYCDLFTAAEAEEYRQLHSIAEKFKWNSKYWYVFFAEEEIEYVYTLFMNQEYFSKEDIIEVARSLKFKEKR